MVISFAPPVDEDQPLFWSSSPTSMDAQMSCQLNNLLLPQGSSVNSLSC